MSADQPQSQPQRWYETPRFTAVVVQGVALAACLFTMYQLFPLTSLNLLRVFGDTFVVRVEAKPVGSRGGIRYMHWQRYEFTADGKQWKDEAHFALWTSLPLEEDKDVKILKVIYLKGSPSYSTIRSNTAGLPLLLIFVCLFCSTARTWWKATRGKAPYKSAVQPSDKSMEVRADGGRPSSFVLWALRPFAWFGVAYVVIWCIILLPWLEREGIAGGYDSDLHLPTVLGLSALVLCHIIALCTCLVLDKRGRSVGRETPILLGVSLAMLMLCAWLM